MKNHHVFILTLVILVCALLSGCESNMSDKDESQQQMPAAIKAALPDIDDMPLRDNAAIYEQYDPVKLVYFYITVRKGNAADKTDHTFEEVNSYYKIQGMGEVEEIKAEAIVQVGDEMGPIPGEIGYSASDPNATIRVRGRTSTLSPQKSYRLDLYDNAGLWRGQKAIVLNKHSADRTRLRNMLYFRLLQDVPDTVSLRTQFVQVYIKDQTKAIPDTSFMDYGLFTQIEVPNGRFLRNHSLSRSGNLYKAEMCEMYRYEDKIRLATDPQYNLTDFSMVLEPKTSNDHSKLITMLEAVNDYATPIESIIEKYFDANNITSYLAFNLLMANPDSNAQNYLLYSPVNSNKWYYLMWDGDASLSYYEEELLQLNWSQAEWMKGISNYWGVVLFNRMLRVPSYRYLLTQKVEELQRIVNPDRVSQFISEYRKTVDPFTRRMPDIINLECTLDQLELIYQNTPSDTARAYRYYLDSLKKPMPFYLGEVKTTNDGLLLQWEAAYDFDAEFVYYQIEIASDWSFEADAIVYASKHKQLQVEAEVPALKEGTYYWRVTATDESGNTQIPFDQVITDMGVHSGMRRFTVEKDGGVTNTP